MAEVLPEKRREDAPERWHPLQDLDSAVERMRQMLDETFAGFGRWPARYADIWSPPVDMEEIDDAYLLEAELPGVERAMILDARGPASDSSHAPRPRPAPGARHDRGCRVQRLRAIAAKRPAWKA
jgi:hypothetical protein